MEWAALKFQSAPSDLWVFQVKTRPFVRMRCSHLLCSTNQFELGSEQPAAPLQRSVGGRIARNGAHILAYFQSTALEQKL